MFIRQLPSVVRHMDIMDLLTLKWLMTQQSKCAVSRSLRDLLTILSPINNLGWSFEDFHDSFSGIRRRSEPSLPQKPLPSAPPMRNNRPIHTLLSKLLCTASPCLRLVEDERDLMECRSKAHTRNRAHDTSCMTSWPVVDHSWPRLAALVVHGSG
jgi:hypothetical protein